MKIPISIPYGKKTLLGILHVPQHRSLDTPIIVFCYGMNGDRVENHRMAYLLGLQAEKKGIILLRIDYYGLGVSNGEYIETSIESKIEDILVSIEYMKGCLQHELQKLLLLGFSDGARVAIGAAKEVDESVQICLWNPVLYELSLDCLGQEYHNSRQNLKLIREPVTNRLAYPLPFTGLLMNLKYLNELSTNSYNMSELINMDCPKMVIFGGEDEKTKETRERLISNHFTSISQHVLKLIDGADHLFSGCDCAEEVINLTIEWALERKEKK